MLTPEPLAGQSSILLISSNHRLMIGLMIFMTKAGFAVAHRFPSCIHCIFLLFLDSFPCLRPSFDSSIYGLKIKTDALALVWPGSVLLSRFHPLHRLVLSNELSLFPSFSFPPLLFSSYLHLAQTRPLLWHSCVHYAFIILAAGPRPGTLDLWVEEA